MKYAILICIAVAQFAHGETLIIHAGQLLDKPGKAPRQNATIVIADGRILEVRDGFSEPEKIGQAQAKVIDLRNKFVMPGLVDCHVHLSNDKGGVARQIAAVTTEPAAEAFDALVNGQKTLNAGFTTVRNLGDDGATLALRDAIKEKKVVGPRIIDAGKGISTTSGHMDGRLGYASSLHEGTDGHNTCDGIESCRKTVRDQIGRGVDVIKIATTGGVNSRIGLGLGSQMFDDEVKTLVETAHLYGKKVAVHAHGADGIVAALKAGADSIEHGTLLDDESIKWFKKTGAYYVPTLSTVNGYIERLKADPEAYPPAVLEKIKWRIGVTGESLKKAYPRGVKIAFGTDAGVSKHGRNADEFELMVKHGMPAAAAIVAATMNAATLLGLEKEIGSIEPGKYADIIAVSGDPLQDITVLKKMEFVMKEGEIIKVSSNL